MGRDLDALEAQLGVPIEETMGFTFEIALPEGDEVQTSSWTLALGEGPTPVAAATEEVNRLAYGLVAASALAVLLLVVVLIVRLVRRRRRRPVFHRS